MMDEDLAKAAKETLWGIAFGLRAVIMFLGFWKFWELMG